MLQAENEALTGLVWDLGRQLGLRASEIEGRIIAVTPDPFAASIPWIDEEAEGG
jgi:hypothetical protein